MDDPIKKTPDALEAELAELKQADGLAQRQVALLSAIVSIFRETATCQSEEALAQVCLRVAEELTGSAYGFIGEINETGLFNTTMVSEAGWRACLVPKPQADQLLKNMPNRGINRIGLQEQRSWIVNDVAHHPDQVARPQGHPELTSFLGVPLHYASGNLGMIALANKAGGYSVTDQEDVEALAVAFLESLNRRRAERQVAQLNEELRRHLHQVELANRELEAFSYSISHDLRAPVRHINAYLELLGKQDLGVLDEKSSHYIEVISEAARRMALLVDGLLNFLHLGRAELKKSPVDLGQLIQEVVHDFATEPRAADIQWQIAPLPVVLADRPMLHTVFANLIANAIKFCRTRSVIKIVIGSGSDASDEVVCFVKDNGVGFDMRYQGKLFGLFQRLHSQEEYEGAGVGLACVQRIIQRHGGRVWASGELDKGATFWFALPAAKEIDHETQAYPVG